MLKVRLARMFLALHTVMSDEADMANAFGFEFSRPVGNAALLGSAQQSRCP